MCYLNQVKHCKTSTMLFLNYIKHNRNSGLCFSTHVKQNVHNAKYLLNYVTPKAINAFCFNQSKQSAISAMFYLNQSSNTNVEQSLLTKKSCLF